MNGDRRSKRKGFSDTLIWSFVFPTNCSAPIRVSLDIYLVPSVPQPQTILPSRTFLLRGMLDVVHLVSLPPVSMLCPKLLFATRCDR
jgi:hypothetical protein